MIAIEVLEKEMNAQAENLCQLNRILEETEKKKARTLDYINQTVETMKDISATIFVLQQMKGNDNS